MELIFVYNADSGLINMLKDAGHKLLRPDTYPCSLCALTWGAVSEKSVWRRFRRQDGRKMRFLHKDEFERAFTQRFEYPVVLSRPGAAMPEEQLSVILSSKRLNELRDVDSLIHALAPQ